MLRRQNFYNKFSKLKRLISGNNIFAENKTYKDLVVSFVTGKSLGTSVSNRAYYIIGDQSRRFLMHEVIPIAYLERSGDKFDIQLNANISESLSGISRVFSHIQSFYSMGNYLVQDKEDINDFFGTQGVDYDIEVSPVGFSSIFSELLNNNGLYNFDKFISKFEELKSIPKYQKLYERYKDRINSSEEDYELVNIKRSNVKYSGDKALPFTQYRDKFRDQIYKLVNGDVPANIADKVVTEIKRLPDMPILASEKSAVGTYSSDIFKKINDYANKYGITSYYDFVFNLISSGSISESEFPAKDLFDSEVANIDSEDRVKVLKSVLIKLSKAFNQITSNENAELVALAKSSDMINFFTYLDTQDVKHIIDDLNVQKPKQKGLFKDKEGKLPGYIDAIYRFQTELFNKIKNISFTSLSPKEEESGGKSEQKDGLAKLIASGSKKYVDDFNLEVTNIVRSVFDDPKVIESLNETAGIYNDLLSKIVKTGGEVSEKKLNTKEDAERFLALAKNFISSSISHNLENLLSKNITGTPYQSLLGDIIRMNSFIDEISNKDLKDKFQKGFLWSGSTFGETELIYSANDGIVDLPIGFITYKSLATKRNHLGEGHILRVEIKDNFIRISMPSFYIGVSKVSDATIIRRIMESSVQYNRMGEFYNKAIIGTLTNKEIQQEQVKDNKELDLLLKGGRTVMYLSKEGGLVSFSNYDSKDYYTMENIVNRGLKVTDLEDFYSRLSNPEVSRKYRKFFLKDDIANAIAGYRSWINKVVSDSKAEWDAISPEDKEFFKKKFESLTAFKTREDWVIDNTRMVMEMKVGDTGAFSVHSIYSLWNTYEEESKDKKDENGKPLKITKVKKIFTPYFRRYTPNPAYVYAFSNVGVSSSAKEKLNMVEKHSFAMKKIAKSMSDYNRKNGINYTYDEGEKGSQYMPTIFEGDVVSGYTKVIDFIKTNYFYDKSTDTIGAGVWMKVDEKILSAEGEEVYRRLVEAQAKIKERYHADIVKIVELLSKIHNLNVELSKIITEFHSKEAKGTTLENTRSSINTEFKKQVLDKFKIEMKLSIQKRITAGNFTLRSVLNQPGIFKDVDKLGKESFDPNKALNLFSDSFVKILEKIHDDVVNSEVSISKESIKKDAENPTFMSASMGKFKALNSEIRKYSMELLTLAASYKLKKSTMMDLIKSGRVENYLQYEQVKAKGRNVDEFGNEIEEEV